jgi:hypothetical protein
VVPHRRAPAWPHRQAVPRAVRVTAVCMSLCSNVATSPGRDGRAPPPAWSLPLMYFSCSCLADADCVSARCVEAPYGAALSAARRV